MAKEHNMYVVFACEDRTGITYYARINPLTTCDELLRLNMLAAILFDQEVSDVLRDI